MRKSAVADPTQTGKRRWHSTGKRRREILDAALSCFLENGVSATTIQQIRTAAKASHGSIYHLFRSKREIAHVLLVEGMEVYGDKIVAALARETTLRGSLHAIISTHVRFIVADPKRAMFLTRCGMAEEIGGFGEAYARHQREFSRTISDHLRPFIDSGEMTNLAPELHFPVIVGATAQLCRDWLSGRYPDDPTRQIETLVLAACKSLRPGAPADKKTI